MFSRTLAFFFLIAAVAAFERFDPTSNTNVKHICVDNPDLPACGPDFCQKNPEAAGCKKSRNFVEAKFTDMKTRYCQKNPTSRFCPNVPIVRSLGPIENTEVKHICVDNPDLPACGPDFCQKNPEAAGCKKSRNFFSATCFMKPNHPGCRRNAYMDKFIAWKIQKDCEINPHGPFCPKTLGKKACKKDSSSSSSSSSSSEENPNREDQELATVDKTKGKKISITGRIFDWFAKAADKFRELSREAAERKRYEEFVKNLKTRNGIKVFSGIVGHQGGYTL